LVDQFYTFNKTRGQNKWRIFKKEILYTVRNVEKRFQFSLKTVNTADQSLKSH